MTRELCRRRGPVSPSHEHDDFAPDDTLDDLCEVRMLTDQPHSDGDATPPELYCVMSRGIAKSPRTRVNETTISNFTHTAPSWGIQNTSGLGDDSIPS